MREIDFSIKIEDEINGNDILKKIERAGRTCYKSEDKLSELSYIDFITAIIKKGHESVLEHEKITVRIICDRGISHEIVRHRIGSYSQESTRYCNYSNSKFSEEITCIKPSFWEVSKDKMDIWRQTILNAEKAYFNLIKLGATPQEARSVLPNSLKTEIVVTYNLREWRHFLKLRTSKSSHPQMREISLEICKQFKELIPVIFDDIIEM